MGTCYSKSGHDASEGNSKNQPLSKEPGRHQPNGSLYVYRPGKDHGSQPTSASQSGNVGAAEKGDEALKVNTIDSGIESLTSSQCNKELKDLAENSELREATDTFELIDNGPCACGENCEVNGHCKFECLSKLPESNVEWNAGHGRPLSQQMRKGIDSSVPLMHRKPRCKGRIERKSSRLSWKSTDSLDWTRTMVTTMDRTTSQVSDIFVDDISLHAPLAHFDSIEFSGEDKETDANGALPKTPMKTVVAVATNNGETVPTAAILISNENQICEKKIERTERSSVQSTEQSNKEMNLEEIVKKQLSSQSLLGSREGESSSLAGSLLSFPPKSEVTSVMVDGKEVVLIDADTYSQTESLNYCDPGNIQGANWTNQAMDSSFTFDQNVEGGTSTALGDISDQIVEATPSSYPSVQPPHTDTPSSAEHLIADCPPLPISPSLAEREQQQQHQTIDAPSSSVPEKMPSEDVSLLAEKLVAQVLPASAAQLGMMSSTPPSCANQTEKLDDPVAMETASQNSKSDPTSSKGQTSSEKPTTKAENLSSNT